MRRRGKLRLIRIGTKPSSKDKNDKRSGNQRKTCQEDGPTSWKNEPGGGGCRRWGGEEKGGAPQDKATKKTNPPPPPKPKTQQNQKKNSPSPGTVTEHDVEAGKGERPRITVGPPQYCPLCWLQELNESSYFGYKGKKVFFHGRTKS